MVIFGDFLLICYMFTSFKIHIFWIVQFVLNSTSTFCQASPDYQLDSNSFFINYRIGNGLISNEVYHVFEDSKGFIWLAHDMGVSRYNGSKFQNFGAKEGLPDISIYEIYEDYLGRIWFMSHSKQLCYYEKGKIHHYKFNSIIKKIFKNRDNAPSKLGFHIDSANTIILGTTRLGLIQIDSSGNYKLFNKPYGTIAYEFNNRFINAYSTQGTGVSFPYIHIINTGKRLMRHELKWNPGGIRFMCKTDQNKILFIKGKAITLYEDTVEISFTTTESNVLWISKISNDTYWLATYKNGLKKLSIIDNRIELSKEIFPEFSVTSITNDYQGGIWLSTLKNGVIYVPYPKAHLLSPSKNLVKLESDNNNRLALIKENTVEIIHRENRINIKSKDLSTPRVKDVIFQEDTLWVGTNWPILKFNSDYIQTKELRVNTDLGAFSKKAGFHIRDMIVSDDELIISGSHGVFKLKNGKNYFAHLNLDEHALINCLYSIGDSIFLGTMSGVQLLYNESVEPFWVGPNNQPIVINDIVAIKDKLILGTQGFGLIVIDLYTKKHVYVEECGVSITQLKIDKDQIWLVSDLGAYKISISPIGIKIEEQLLTNDFQCSSFKHLALLKNEILINSDKGVLSFPRYDKINVDVPTKIGVSEIQINDQVVPLEGTYSLDYKNSNVSINLFKLDFKEKKIKGFLYNLDGSDTSWVPIQSSTLFFPSLNAGEHLIRFKINGGNSNEVAVKIIVAGPFWKSWWFIGLTLLAIGYIGFILQKIIQKTRNKKLIIRNQILEFEKESVELKNEALRSQINPHFLFNCFSSLSKLHKSKPEDVNNYLSNLSSLLRHVLNSSTERVLPIEEEIDLINSYLYLQQIRMGNSFEYEINIDDELIEEELKIPSMILQPYIENAIEHGIRDVKNGKINISIKLKDDYIFALVQDNGRGLKARGSNGKNHRSKSMKITQDRIKIMNKEGSDLFKVEILDLEIKENNPGTRVCVTLPYFS